MEQAAQHPYFIFDPQFDDDDLTPEFDLYVKEWAGSQTPWDNTATSHAFSLWASHSFVMAYDDDEAEDDSYHYNDNCIGVYSKSHNSSAALRSANLPLYSLRAAAGGSHPKVVVGYQVSLPEHLSQRQIAWLNLFELPTYQGVATTTLDEYNLLRHIKVLSPSHKSVPLEAYQVTSPLAKNINEILDGVPPSLTALSPSMAGKIISARTQFLEKLKYANHLDDEMYRLQAQANRHLLVRTERLNQIKALIYSDYYVSPSRYLSDTHKIAPTWIQKLPIYDDDDLLYREHGADGWFRSEYQPNTLLTALTALACVGYWSIDCDSDNPSELLTTASEGFLYAHQSDEGSNRRLYQIIYHAQNPFDLKRDLVSFNALMPVLAAIFQEPLKKADEMALFFDDAERAKSLIDILSAENGYESVIQRFIDAMKHG